MSTRGRGVSACLAAAILAAASIAAPAVASSAGQAARAQPAAASSATSYRVPAGGLPIAGHGYGNGIGLSQWGAYGAATEGLSATQILDFYYPHTTTKRLSTNRTIRVLLMAGAGGQAWAGVAQVDGLAVTSGGTTTTLPATIRGKAVQAWRLRRSGSALTLQDRLESGWHDRATPAVSSVAEFTDPANQVTVSTSDGLDRTYRGGLTVTLTGGTLYAVDTIGIEDYIAGVVPDEMPASWPAPALQAQAIAARSYATYQMRHPRSSVWDVYADTRDQAYGGVAAQTAATNQAVKATAGRTRFDADGAVIFAAYGAADGGYTVAGTVAGQRVSYLPAQRDPYDDAVPNSASAWTATITRSALQAAYPQVGTPSAVQVDGRDGHGQWGGRITSVTVRGSSGSESVSGTGFAYALGLRGPWWAPQLPPGPVRQAVATTASAGRAVTARWRSPAAQGGRVKATGYRVIVRPGNVRTTVAAGATSATVTGLPAATSYAVTIRPTSAVGAGAPVTVSSALRRIGGSDPVVARSHEIWRRHAASAAVLVDSKDPAAGLAAPVLAGVAAGPVLLSRPAELDAATGSELHRVLPAGSTVWLLGGFTSAVAGDLRSAGWRVHRIRAAGAPATAAAVADAVQKLDSASGSRPTGLFEADVRRPGQAAVAAAAARGSGGVLLLTDGSRMPSATTHWLRRHPRLAHGRWAVGSSAVKADPAARAVNGGDSSALSVTVAKRFFATASSAAVAGAGDLTSGLAAAASGGPLLLDRSRGSVPAVVVGWLSSARSGLSRVDLVGDSRWLPYDPVATSVDGALLNS